MLTFEQKIAIMESFPELQRKNVSLGRVNFHYEDSAYDKKTVGYHFHPNGNGYIYAGQIEGAETDDKGLVNIRDYSEEQLRDLAGAAIRSLTAGAGTSVTADDKTGSSFPDEQTWVNADGNVLTVKLDDEMWFIHAGLNLDSVFESYEEAVEYLEEEGFARKK
ncbi:hypothetical protein PC41400_25895 [Paenibacillus chitinolyticus]|uniref:Uncharacterized protein n=1 Tax=Paenibacillus chitinolyticus TaxID=79263 RepID=A0A410X2T4_9BACL|nr:hypothetical protein [Paenibacillus chitinolyticus]MCY9593803.1 hypothetical protein [Paenibacillus chitinolyticus]MCY9599308.1 hypothetical protein [Paenibacillus chitinolyticus]QAV20934.1 hypothetical protein PC41400_25895 [Paenibacillus chitinolyticus]